MSTSVEIQTLIFQRLTTDPRVTAIVGQKVFDRRPDPSKTSPDFPCVCFGPSDFLPSDPDCIAQRDETIQLDCFTRDGGKLSGAKRLVDAVKASLHDYEADLGDAGLLEMKVLMGRTYLDPDGLTSHGVIQVRCLVEE